MKALAFIFACVLIAACDTSLTANVAGLGPGQGSGSDTCAVRAVIVTPDTATLRVNQTLQPSAAVQSCASSANEGVRWTSSDTTIASVDAKLGFIQARRVGNAIVTAAAVADTSMKGTVRISVTP
jgi:uncharacterized protein YjdB